MRVLNINLGKGFVRSRLNLIAGDPDKHFDRDSIEHEFDTELRRSDVFDKQGDAFEEW
jgi:hypothetical protein